MKGRFDAVEIGHADVHDDHIGLQGFCQGDGFAAVVGFADDCEIGLLLDEETQAAANEFVVVGEKDANFSHGSSGYIHNLAVSGESALWSGSSAFTVAPFPEPDSIAQRATEAAYALFHAQDSHAALAFGIEAVAIVGDFHCNFIGILHDGYFRVFGRGVCGGVVESFLHEAVNGDFGFVAQIFRHIFRLNFHFHIAAAGNFAGLPFQSGDQAEVVEHGRTEKQRDVADGFDGRFGDGFYLGNLRLSDGSSGGTSFESWPTSTKSAPSDWPTSS